MTGYTVASGSSIRWSGGVVVGGQPVPAELLAEWSEETIKANLDSGSIVADAPARPASKERTSEERPA